MAVGGKITCTHVVLPSVCTHTHTLTVKGQRKHFPPQVSIANSWVTWQLQDSIRFFFIQGKMFCISSDVRGFLCTEA